MIDGVPVEIQRAATLQIPPILSAGLWHKHSCRIETVVSVARYFMTSLFDVDVTATQLVSVIQRTTLAANEI
jgi:hypothetical protein